MMTFVTDNPRQCGIVELDHRGVVTAFHEKQERPPGNIANGAVFFMEPEIFSVLASCKAEQPDISLDVLPECLGRIATWENAVYHRDIGTPQSYAQALKDYR